MGKDCSLVSDAMRADVDDGGVGAVQEYCNLSGYADANDPYAKEPEGTTLEDRCCELMVKDYDREFKGNK